MKSLFANGRFLFSVGLGVAVAVLAPRAGVALPTNPITISTAIGVLLGGLLTSITFILMLMTSTELAASDAETRQIIDHFITRLRQHVLLVLVLFFLSVLACAWPDAFHKLVPHFVYVSLTSTQLSVSVLIACVSIVIFSAFEVVNLMFVLVKVKWELAKRNVDAVAQAQKLRPVQRTPDAHEDQR